MKKLLALLIIIISLAPSMVVGFDLESSVPLEHDMVKVINPPAKWLPGYRVPADTPFGTKVFAIADTPGTTVAGFSQVWATDARHHYSKDQPWNATMELFVIQNTGIDTRLILDGSTYLPKYEGCPGYTGDDRWHPQVAHKNERIGAKDTLFQWYDVTTCTQTRFWTLPFDANGFGDGEGNPSLDGRYAAIYNNNNGDEVVLIDMDPQPPLASYASGNKRMSAILDISSGLSGNSPVTWVSVSPLGTYLVVHYSPNDIVRVYDIDWDNLTISPHAMPANSPACTYADSSNGNTPTTLDPTQGWILSSGHADMQPNPFDNNEEVLIGQRRSTCPDPINGVDMGYVIMTRLSDNTVTTLTDDSNEGSMQHTSSRNYLRPGYVYVTYYNYNADTKKFNDELIAVKLDGSFKGTRLAHKFFDSSGCYRCEAHPVPSPDGRRVAFVMTRGSTTDPATYIVDTRF